MELTLITTQFMAEVSFDRTNQLSLRAVSVFFYEVGRMAHFFVPGRSSRKNQKWRGPDENIRANLRQYGTEDMYLDVMVSDASKHVWKNAALFDAIITDRRFLVSKQASTINA